MNKITYALVYLLWYIGSLLPLWVLYGISNLLYYLVRYVVRYRLKVVRANIEASFPQRSERERRQIACDFYRTLCDYMVETIKLFTLSKEEMMKRMKFEGIEEIYQKMKRDDKALCFVYLGHFGNWEWIASLPNAAPEGLNCAQIYHPLYNKAFDRLFLKVRSKFGGENIPMRRTLRRVIEMKRSGQKTIIGFISDQLPKWESIHHFTPFLQRETAVFTGTEQMAKQLDALVYYAHVERPKRGYYTCRFIPITDKPKDTLNFTLTDFYMQQLEQMIQQDPHLWLWSHKRWKRTKEQWLERQNKSEEV